MMLTVDSKRLFPLDPNLIYLNHGAFGVTPVAAKNSECEGKSGVSGFTAVVSPHAKARAGARLSACMPIP
jgi:hypothetical protein